MFHETLKSNEEMNNAWLLGGVTVVRVISVLLVGALIYNVVTFTIGSRAFGETMLTIGLNLGSGFMDHWGDGLILLSIVLLYVMISKSTATIDTSPTDHGFYGENGGVSNCISFGWHLRTPVFVMIVVMSAVDVVEDFSINITAS